MKLSRKNKKGRDPVSAVSRAFLRDGPFLKKFVSRFITNHHDIEDVAQEAYMRAFAAEQKKDGEVEEPRAFLFKIARNVAISRLRKKSEQITGYIEDLSVPLVIEEADPEKELQANQHINVYCEAIARLPKNCREAFLLRKVHGMKHKDIAKQMNVSLSSVEKYLKRAFVETRAYLREMEGETSDASEESIAKNDAEIAK